MPVKTVLPILVTDRHYHNSGPEKMRRANSKFLPISCYLFIHASGSLVCLKSSTCKSLYLIWSTPFSSSKNEIVDQIISGTIDEATQIKIKNHTLPLPELV